MSWTDSAAKHSPMNRRSFLLLASAPPALVGASLSRVVVPVRRIFDRRSTLSYDQLLRSTADAWWQAVRDFSGGGIQIQAESVRGEIRRSPSGMPIFTDLSRGALNLVITDLVPMGWDRGRGLAGATTRYQGYDLSVVSARNAHGHLLPFVSVNTFVHEILHAVMQDVEGDRPPGWRAEAREVRIDMYATRLWLFHDGAPVRESAAKYVEHLRASPS